MFIVRLPWSHYTGSTVVVGIISRKYKQTIPNTFTYNDIFLILISGRLSWLSKNYDIKTWSRLLTNNSKNKEYRHAVTVFHIRIFHIWQVHFGRRGRCRCRRSGRCCRCCDIAGSGKKSNKAMNLNCFITVHILDSLWPGDGIWYHRSGSSLVEVTASHRFGAKPLSAQMSGFCQ